jgi:hypothetical protein
MAKEIARYTSPGGGTVTLHHGGMFAAIAGSGAWYECTGCGPGRHKVTNWSNSAQADLVDYDGTEQAAEIHAANCRRNPRR